MAQPSQEFPPWLSPSAFLVTNAAGATIATDTSIVYIPPTYFGPSIPLGTLYVFGGSTTPATVVLPSPTPQTTTTVAPPSTTAITSLTTSLTTTATPTTVSSTIAISTSLTTSAISTSSLTTSAISTSSLTTSAITTSSSAITTTSVSNTLTSTSSMPMASTTSTSSPTAVGPAEMAGLTKGQLVGVIVASILGLIFLFVLALFLYLWCRGRRNRRAFNSISQGIDDDYYFVPSGGGGREPGEGSPRHSGEEQDPFLQRSSSAGYAPESSAAGGTSMGMGIAAGAGAAGATQMSQVHNNNSASHPVVSRIPAPVPTNGSNNSDSTASHASGFGVLLDRPSMSLGLLPIPADNSEHRMSGRALSERDMERIGRESVLPDDLEHYPDEEYTGAYAYSRESQYTAPRLVDPTATTPLLGDDEQLPFTARAAEGSPELLHQTSFEEPTLLTARRVKVEDLGPRTASQTSSAAVSPATAVPEHRSSGGFLGALGLANLGRLTWFRNADSPRHSGVHEPSYMTDPLSEKDIETGRSLLSPSDAVGRDVDSFGNRTRGFNPDGSRPRSGVSARSGTSVSGATLYHDAQSSAPSTPLLAPLPRAITPADNGHSQAQSALSEHAWLAGSRTPPSGVSSPPGYDQQLAGPSGTTSLLQSPTATSFDHSLSADILDMPAPTAITHFASISSLKETATGSSMGYKPVPFPPPGLDTVRPIGWSDVGGNASPVSPFGVRTSMDAPGEHGTGISIDILEEAPPDAERGWRTMSSQATAMDVGRRGTFGTYVPGHMIIASEQGSLHSMMPSHFPPSSRSTGSAPTSRHDLESSIGSSSSRPSARSAAGSFPVSHHSATASAAVQSLSHKGSISSDDRRRPGAISPALSAFGHQTRHGSRSNSNSGSGVGSSHDLLAPPSAHFSPDRLHSTLRGVPSSDSTTVMDTSYSTVRGVHAAPSLSPLSGTFPLNTPWAGGLDSDWQASSD